MTSSEQDGEFVAAQSREQGASLRGFPQSIGDSLQHTVTIVVTERVVDRLEIVYVHEQQAELLTGRSGRAPTRRPAARITGGGSVTA